MPRTEPPSLPRQVPRAEAERLWRRAARLEAEGAEMLSSGQVLDIAREAGIDPAYVIRAARESCRSPAPPSGRAEVRVTLAILCALLWRALSELFLLF